jgi:hypothetical protein
MATEHESQPSSKQLADLSALADGTLAPARHDEVEATIAASPELRGRLERERRAVAMLHEAAGRDRAPLALRERIERERRQARTPARRRMVSRGAIVVGLAIVVVALVLVLPGGTPGAPTLSQAAALAGRGAVQAAPMPDPSDPHGRLARNVDDVYFPNWGRSLGWQATGQRVDRLGGRRAVTVYYQWRGIRIAYTILSTPPLAQPSAASTVRRGGLSLRSLVISGRTVVTWRQAGHTCVLSGAHVNAQQLEQLAAWKA